MKLNNIKIFVSPLTQQVYLCNVNGNTIKEKYKLNKDELVEFLTGSVLGLAEELTNEFYIEDDKLKIDIKITYKYREPRKEDIDTLNTIDKGESNEN